MTYNFKQARGAPEGRNYRVILKRSILSDIMGYPGEVIDLQIHRGTEVMA